MSYADRDGVIWMDGRMVPWREANVHVLTHSLHYGVGAFEGIRAYKTPSGPAIFRLQDHTDRLFRSAHILGMRLLVVSSLFVLSCAAPPPPRYYVREAYPPPPACTRSPTFDPRDGTFIDRYGYRRRCI